MTYGGDVAFNDDEDRTDRIGLGERRAAHIKAPHQRVLTG